MSEQPPKRKVGRPKKPPDADVTFEVTLPRHHFNYLTYLALTKRRLGTTAREAAEHILIRDLDEMFRTGYHAKEIPEA
jgi:hypothetical protein